MPPLSPLVFYCGLLQVPSHQEETHVRFSLNQNRRLASLTRAVECRFNSGKYGISAKVATFSVPIGIRLMSQPASLRFPPYPINRADSYGIGVFAVEGRVMLRIVISLPPVKNRVLNTENVSIMNIRRFNGSESAPFYYLSGSRLTLIFPSSSTGASSPSVSPILPAAVFRRPEAGTEFDARASP